MSSNANRLPADWQAIFINRVRSVGVWCDAPNSGKLRHYFVCRNAKANVAISLCGQMIIAFDKLHENQLSQKCLICELYNTGNQEVKEKILARHDGTIERTIKPDTTIQE